MSSRPAAGGGRWVDGFAERHGRAEVTADGDGLLLTAADGATAELSAPPGVPGCGDLAGFLDAVRAERRLGLLLARKGGVAVGVAEGERLVSSKVDTRYVQGRTAAGGWSQQRFARRRDNQAKAALSDATELAVRLLLPEAGTLAALVTGGDRRTVDGILSDRRLAPLAGLRADRLLDVPEPRHAVLVEAARAARSVRILVRDPDPVSG
ncbi:MAG TPA: acVLRF1 family peptidyl-tRNA hydrolase [Micromonospora sp.]